METHTETRLTHMHRDKTDTQEQRHVRTHRDKTHTHRQDRHTHPQRQDTQTQDTQRQDIGTEKHADRLAGMAAVEIGRAVDWAHVLNALREAGREKYSSTDCEYETLLRLTECNVKMRVVRKGKCV